jgi:pimeloyl-ACP methyl ester carboxylesterase
MDTQLEVVESGPVDAAKKVLLLPGGMCSARSFAEVMAEPVLADTRLIAITLPGHAGAPPPADFSTESYARLAAEYAKGAGVDVVVCFSMGAMVTYEMVVSGSFVGPVVLLGASLSAADEPAFFRAIIRLGSPLGTLPAAVLKVGAASMVKKAPLPPERRAPAGCRLRAEQPTRHAPRPAGLPPLDASQRRSRPAVLRGRCAGVVRARGEGRRCADAARAGVLEACPHVDLVTIPGHVFFLPNEVPTRIADVIVEALARS